MIVESLLSGLKQTFRVTQVIVWMFLLTILLALVPAALVSQALEESVGNSRFAEELQEGYSDVWFKEFSAEARGLAATFDPTVIKLGAILNGWDSFLSGKLPRMYLPLFALGVSYALLWVFAAGGVLVSFKERKSQSFSKLIASSGLFFGRFLRLTAIFWAAYLGIFLWLIPWLDGVIGMVSRDVIDERTAFFLAIVKFGIVGILLFGLNLLSDYAKILTVLENRRSSLLAIFRSLELPVKYPKEVFALAAVLLVLAVTPVVVYGVFVPEAGEKDWSQLLTTLLLGQGYILSRIVLRLFYWGSEFELCRSLLSRGQRGTGAGSGFNGAAESGPLQQ